LLSVRIRESQPVYERVQEAVWASTVSREDMATASPCAAVNNDSASRGSGAKSALNPPKRAVKAYLRLAMGASRKSMAKVIETRENAASPQARATVSLFLARITE